MSLTLYDASLLAKFRSVFPNTYIATTESVFQMIGEQGKEIKLPVINIYNTGYEVLGQLYNFPEMRTGRPMSFKDVDTKEEIVNVQSLPVRIDYQIDFADNSRDRLNGILKEIIFWLYKHPMMQVTEPSTKTVFDFAIQIEGGVQDNSDIMSFADRGRIYRNTMNLVVPSARFFMNKRAKTVLQVLVDEYFGDDFDPDSLIDSTTFSVDE